MDSLKYVNCLWTPSFTFPFHLGQGTTRLFEFHFFQLVFKIACFSDWLPTVLDTRMKTWEVFPYENEITDHFLATSLLGLLYGFFRDLHWCRVPRHLIFPQDKGWEYAKSEKKNDLRRLQFKQLQKEAWKKFQFSTGFGPLSPRHQFTRTNQPTKPHSHTIGWRELNCEFLGTRLTGASLGGTVLNTSQVRILSSFYFAMTFNAAYLQRSFLNFCVIDT